MNSLIQKLALLLAVLMTAFGMNAAPVDMRIAQDVAVKFMNANTNTPLRGADELQLVSTYSISHGEAAFYVFNTPTGFVIVSADNCATPILGYSSEGQFDVNNIPIQMQDYLQGFVEQIEYGIENHLEADENISRQWELVRNVGRLNENRDGEVVEPLITALWNQGCYYNAMCPEDPDGSCGHALTGCVATAMGMILHYWGYPVQGTGSHTYTPLPYPTTQYPEQSVNFGETTYDWAHMPDQLTDTSTQTEIDAVATLLWHCGVAVDMNYSPYGSGTDQHFTTLIDYFGYSDDLHWESRQDDESWLSLLKADLDLGRPVFYTGFRCANSGHAFVCDGYDVNDRFHFNWGWGGNSNGYFALNATMVFVYDNEAIFNIHPNVSTTCQVTVSACPADGGYVSGAGLYDIGSICTLTATANEGYTFVNWTEDGEEVSTDSIYSFVATGERNLVANFVVSQAEQTVELSAGWSWWSTNLDITLDDLKNAIADAVGNDGTAAIKTQGGAITYRNGQWRGNGIQSLDIRRMYEIQTSVTCEITLVGTPVNPSEYEITITPDNNWIGFLSGTNMTLGEAFGTFPVNGDVVTSKDHSSVYRNGQWRGQLNTLQPGHGYIYQSHATGERTFIFPTGVKLFTVAYGASRWPLSFEGGCFVLALCPLAALRLTAALRH